MPRWQTVTFLACSLVSLAIGFIGLYLPAIGVGMVLLWCWALRYGDARAIAHALDHGGGLEQALDFEIDELNAELRLGLECLWIEYADDKLTIPELESCAERQYAMYDAQIEKIDARRPRLRWATDPSVVETDFALPRKVR